MLEVILVFIAYVAVGYAACWAEMNMRKHFIDEIDKYFWNDADAAIMEFHRGTNKMVPQFRGSYDVVKVLMAIYAVLALTVWPMLIGAWMINDVIIYKNLCKEYEVN